MNFGFAPRIATVVAIILISGLALTSVLSIHKFQNTYSDLLTSRFEFVATDIRQGIHTQLDLGLPLENLEGVTEKLDFFLHGDDQILSIEVFDEYGTVVFGTDPSFVGDLVAEEWLILRRLNLTGESWSALDKKSGVVGVNLRNNLDQDVGSVALRYSRQFLDQIVAEQIERLSKVGIVVAIVMTLFSLLGCIVLLRRSTLDLKNMKDTFDDIRSKKKQSESIQTSTANHPELEAFVNTTYRVQNDLDDATHQIHQIDEEKV